MDKNKSIKARKFLVNGNIPQFDIGKNLIISSGRLTSVTVDPTQFGSTPGYTGYNKDAQTYKNTQAANTASKITSTISTINSISPITTGIQDTIGYLGGTFGPAAEAVADTLEPTASAINASISAGTSTAASTAASTTAGAVGSATGETAASTAGSTAGSLAGSVGGYIASAIGTTKGIIDLVSAFGNYDNKITSQDMLLASSTSTQSKFGRTYKQIGGFDENGVLNLTSALNAADTTNATLSGLETGSGIGGGVGLIFGPIGSLLGSAIGAGLGSLTGWLFGDSEADKREKAVKLYIELTKKAIGGWNTQSESEAGSAGLRDMYNAAHNQSTTGILRADKGKNINKYDGGKPTVGTIQTENGTEFGKIEGYALPREGIVNYYLPQTHYLGSINPNIKEPRVDNIPVGSNYDFGKDIILGNKPIDGKSGTTWADLGRIPLKQNEEINKKREAGVATPEDEITYMRNWKYLRSLGDLQMKATGPKSLLADKGKNRKFDGGWSDYLEPLAGLASRAIPALAYTNMVNSDQPYAQNSFVPNSSASNALRILGSLGYNPSAVLLSMNNTARLNRYIITHTPGTSGGMQAHLSTSANNLLFSQRAAILQDAYNKNAAYKTAYANALMSSGQAEATRAQQALATQQENYRQAVGAKQQLQASAIKNWANVINQSLQDFSTNRFQNRMLDLWDKNPDVYGVGRKSGITSESTPKSTPRRIAGSRYIVPVTNPEIKGVQEVNLYEVQNRKPTFSLIPKPNISTVSIVPDYYPSYMNQTSLNF